MAYGKISNIKVRGIVCAVPDNRTEMRRHTDLFPAEDLQRLEKQTGVTATYTVLEKQTASDVCCEAANTLLDKLGWERESIGALIYVSTNFDYHEPATASVLQHRLGLPIDCMVEDINLGCSAYVYGLATIGSLMQTSDIKRALLLCGENVSKTTDYSGTADLLYGDAGSATAIEKDETGGDCVRYLLRADGSKYKAIFARGGGSRHMDDKDVHTRTSGVDVFAYSLREEPKAIMDFISHNGIDPDDVDLYAFYQANEKVVDRIIKRCKLPPEKVPMSLTLFGNTGAASIPIAIVSTFADKERGRDLHILMSGFGVGLSWGAADMILPKDACLSLFFTKNYYDDENDRTVSD